MQTGINYHRKWQHLNVIIFTLNYILILCHTKIGLLSLNIIVPQL